MTLSTRAARVSLPWSLSLAGLLSGCAQGAPGVPSAQAAPEDPPPHLVSVAAVSHGPLPRPIRAAGLVAAKREANLAFLESGRLVWVGVETGAHVRRGQVLARIEPTPFDADARRAAAELDKASRDVARAKALVASGSIAQSGLDDATTGEAVARASLDAARFAAEHTALVAPDDGTVDARLLDPGTIVGAGTPVLRLSGQSQGAVVRAGLPDRDAVGLEVGRAATVTIDARPGETLRGQVTRVAPEATPGSGTFEVEVRIEGRHPELFSGLTAKLAIDRMTYPAASVPLSAVIAGDAGRAWVFGLAEGVVHRSPVRVAFLSGGVAALDELPADVAQVVTAGGNELTDGARVRVAEASLGAAR
jgi:RND family efflux transporter MFP subunit